jgi:hypothetical protein
MLGDAAFGTSCGAAFSGGGTFAAGKELGGFDCFVDEGDGFATLSRGSLSSSDSERTSWTGTAEGVLGREADLLDVSTDSNGRFVAEVGNAGDSFATGVEELGEDTSGLSSRRGRFFVIGASTFAASHFFIISIARLPGVKIGEGLRLTHSHTFAALIATELLAILMQLSHNMPQDLSLFKYSRGVSLSEKLLKGSQVFDVGG